MVLLSYYTTKPRAICQILPQKKFGWLVSSMFHVQPHLDTFGIYLRLRDDDPLSDCPIIGHGPLPHGPPNIAEVCMSAYIIHEAISLTQAGLQKTWDFSDCERYPLVN